MKKFHVVFTIALMIALFGVCGAMSTPARADGLEIPDAPSAQQMGKRPKPKPTPTPKPDDDDDPRPRPKPGPQDL